MVATTLLAALIDLSGHQHYVHWGRLSVSAGNLAVVAIMVAIFVLAVLLPPRRARRGGKG